MHSGILSVKQDMIVCFHVVLFYVSCDVTKDSSYLAVYLLELP